MRSSLDDWPLDGRMSGEFHLYGEYQTAVRLRQAADRRRRRRTASRSRPRPPPAVRGRRRAARRHRGHQGRRRGDRRRLRRRGTARTRSTSRGDAAGRDADALNFPRRSRRACWTSPPAAAGCSRRRATTSGSASPTSTSGTKASAQVSGALSMRGNMLTRRARRRVAAPGRLGHRPRRVDAAEGRRADVPRHRYVARSVRARVPAGVLAVHDGRRERHGPHRRRARDPEHLRVDANVDDVALRLFDYAVEERRRRFALSARAAACCRSTHCGWWARTRELDVGGTVTWPTNRSRSTRPATRTSACCRGSCATSAARARPIHAQITGPLDKPVFSGNAPIAGGRLRHFRCRTRSKRSTASSPSTRRGVRLDGLTARLGGGAVRFGGRIAMYGYRLGEFDVTATGEGMRLRYPEGIRSLVDADLSLRGPFTAPVVGGTVTVKSAVWARRFDTSIRPVRVRLAGGERRVARGGRKSRRLPAALRHPAGRAVRRCASTTTWRASWRAPISTLRGTYDRPLLFGRAEIEHGEVTFEGRRYLVTRGSIDFANPIAHPAVLRHRGADARARPGPDLQRDAEDGRHHRTDAAGVHLRSAAADARHPDVAVQRSGAERRYRAGGAAAARTSASSAWSRRVRRAR